MGGPSFKFAIPVALMTAALCLSACGGSESTESPGADSQPGASTASESESGGSSEGTTTGGGSASSHPSEPPRGEVSPRSASFRGGHSVMKHLPEFGVEGSEGKRDEAQAVLGTYLRTIGAQEWEKACPYIGGELRAQINQIATQLKPPAKTCGPALQKYVAAVSGPNEFQDYATAKIASFRAKADAGFALLHGSDGENYWVAMKVEGGEWKVLTLLPQAFG